MHAAATPSSGLPRALRWIYLFALLALLGAAGGCAGLPPGANFPKSQSIALEHPETTPLGKQFAAAAQAHPGQSAFRLVPVGVDGFLLRAQMIDAAQKTLDMQYYIFKADETGKLLMDAMLRAADRGVRVRLLVDDLDNLGQDSQVEALDAHQNIEVRLFNPLRYRGKVKAIRGMEMLLWAPRIDHRMHNKLMVIDNSIALVGGRNIGDEYFQVDPDGQQGDFETFAGGPIVPELSHSFDVFWKSVMAIPAQALFKGESRPEALAAFRQELREHRQEKREDGSDYYSRIATGEPLRGTLGGRIPLVWAAASVEYDSPEKKAVDAGEKGGRLMRHAIGLAARETQEDLRMISAYFIPGEDGMRMFDHLKERGVEIHLLTNSLAANPERTAQSGYMHYRRRLLDDGVDLYEVRADPESARGTAQSVKMSSYGNFGLHTKLYIFDRKRIFIGSMNFDQRSLHLNTELGLMIASPELAEQGVRFFNALTQPANSYHVVLEKDGKDGQPHVVWHTEEDKQPVAYDHEPAKDAWQRMSVEMLSLLHFDSEL
ncbi:MAG TPA: phospholipase D family protein [Burkholderiales bacterium]|jgi:putative cardiolipin synthase|nr:phospholipase D family protein [Burkholderiales bacterium]